MNESRPTGREHIDLSRDPNPGVADHALPGPESD